MSRVIRETFFPVDGDADKPDRVREYQFNQVGSRTKGVDEKGNPFFVEYDAMQRATKVTYCDGSAERLGYGKNSGSDLFDSSSFNATSTKVAGGPATEIQNDANYRRTTVVSSSGKDAANPQVFAFRYDAMGNLTQEIAPQNRRTIHEYDALNRLIKTTLPDGRIERTFYSSTGLKYATIDATGGRVEQTFDAAGEPIEKEK